MAQLTSYRGQDRADHRRVERHGPPAGAALRARRRARRAGGAARGGADAAGARDRARRRRRRWCCRATSATAPRCSPPPSRRCARFGAHRHPGQQRRLRASPPLPRVGPRRHGAHDARQLPRHAVLDQGAAAADGRAPQRLDRVRGLGGRQARGAGGERLRRVEVRPGRAGRGAVDRGRGRRRPRAHRLPGHHQHAVLRRGGAGAHAAGRRNA